MSAATGVVPQEQLSQIIPNYLVRETINGTPFFYKGFQLVLDGSKTKVEIMADSGLQGLIKTFFATLIARQLDLEKYEFFVGEIGAHLDKNNNLSLDIAIYDQSILTPDKITNKYLSVAPKVVIEIDVNVESGTPSHIFDEFVLQKIRKLHEFGTEKVIWIFTKSKIIIVATPDDKWEVVDWNKEIELLDKVTFNIATYLEQKGISIV